MKKRNKIIISVVALALVAGAIAIKVTSSNKNKYMEVKTSTVTTGDIKSYLSTTGTIKSQNSKEYFGLTGKVLRVNYKVGDKVKKGDILVTYDASDLNAQVKSAELTYNNAVLQKNDAVNQNNDILNKIKELDAQIANPANSVQVISNLKTQRDSLKATSSEKFKQLDNTVASAKINLDLSKQKLSSGGSIVSEFDGTVTAVNVTAGSSGITAQSQGAAVVVQNLDNLKVLISVGKYDAGKVALGQDAVIKSNGKEYKGKVTVINPAATKIVSATGADASLGIEVNITDSASGLKAEFDCDVDILLAEVKNVIKIPSESLKTDKTGKSYVYIINGDKAKEVAVKIGTESDTEIQIAEGLKSGDKVILNPSTSITDGVLVKEAAGTK